MKKIKKVIAIAIFIILVFSLKQVYGQTLKLDIKASKEKVKIGDEVTITVDWKDGMQAIDYVLKYDSSKLEYVSSSLEDTYINKNKTDRIGVSWFSSDDTDLSKMTFTFKAIEKGKTEINAEIDGGFADKNLNQPDNYDTSKKVTIEIKKGVNKVVIFLLILVVALIVIFRIIRIKNKKNKKLKR